MVTTRNKKKSQDVEQAVKPPSMDAGAGSGSDDDAPEEIGLELSKQVHLLMYNSSSIIPYLMDVYLSSIGCSKTKARRA